MSLIRFAPWWKHRTVELVSEGGEAWLVGKGPWPLDDIWGRQVWLPNEWEARRGFVAGPGPRISTAVYLAFASIRTPEQAVAFASHVGLLGLRRVDDPQLFEFPTDPEAWARWKRGDGLLTYRLAGLRGPDGQEYVLAEAAAALRLSGADFTEALAFLKSTPGAPLLYPEPVSEWLRLARLLREFLEGVGVGAWFGHGMARSELAVEGIEGFSRAGEPVFRYDALRDAIFLQAALAKTAGDGTPRQCEAPGCSRWFLSTYVNARYCSPECKRRTQNQRAYARRRQRQPERGEQHEPSRSR